MDDALLEIFDEELRSRVEQLRLALAMTGSVEVAARKQALYDAHLQAHTVKGSSEQLGFKESAHLAGAMAAALEQARARNELSKVVTERLERGCNALLAWLDNGREVARPLVFAAASFALEDAR